MWRSEGVKHRNSHAKVPLQNTFRSQRFNKKAGCRRVCVIGHSVVCLKHFRREGTPKRKNSLGWQLGERVEPARDSGSEQQQAQDSGAFYLHLLNVQLGPILLNVL